MPTPRSGDQRLDFLEVVQRLVQSCPLDVEDLASERKYGLSHSVSRRLGGSTSRVALDQEQLALAGVLAHAIAKFAGQAKAVHGVAATDAFCGFSRRFAGALGDDGFVHYPLSDGRVLIEELVEAVVANQESSLIPEPPGVTSLTLSCEL